MSRTPFSPLLSVLLESENDDLQKVSIRNHCKSVFLKSFLGNNDIAEQQEDEQSTSPLPLPMQASSGPDLSDDDDDEIKFKSLEPLGYPDFKVHFSGKVWSDVRQVYLEAKPRPGDGACRANLYDQHGKRVTRYVCDLMARAFIGDPLVLFAHEPVGQYVVTHVNGNQSDNQLTNLRWMKKNAGHVPSLPLRPPTFVSQSQKTMVVHNRGHLKNGLLRPITWYVYCGVALLPNWIPFLTWFNLEDALEDLHFDEASQEQVQAFFNGKKNGTVIQFGLNRFELEMDEDEPRYFKRQQWKAVTFDHCRPIQVSLCGLVRELNVKQQQGHQGGFSSSIGSGQINHCGVKVYYAHPTRATGGLGRPEIRVDELVLWAWLGVNYSHAFLNEEERCSDEGWQIVHLDGNCLNNHLFNLAVLSNHSGRELLKTHPLEWAQQIDIVYSNNADLKRAAREREFSHIGPNYVLQLYKMRLGVFAMAPATTNNNVAF